MLQQCLLNTAKPGNLELDSLEGTLENFVIRLKYITIKDINNSSINVNYYMHVVGSKKTGKQTLHNNFIKRFRVSRGQGSRTRLSAFL